jgi:hypothetical protein
MRGRGDSLLCFGQCSQQGHDREIELPELRTVSIFAQGWGWLVRRVVRGRLWDRLWLLPEPWPTPPADLTIYYHPTAA